MPGCTANSEAPVTAITTSMMTAYAAMRNGVTPNRAGGDGPLIEAMLEFGSGENPQYVLLSWVVYMPLSTRVDIARGEHSIGNLLTDSVFPSILAEVIETMAEEEGPDESSRTSVFMMPRQRSIQHLFYPPRSFESIYVSWIFLLFPHQISSDFPSLRSPMGSDIVCRRVGDHSGTSHV